MRFADKPKLRGICCVMKFNKINMIIHDGQEYLKKTLFVDLYLLTQNSSYEDENVQS